MRGAGKSRANRLIKEASSYLRQHAHNPVDWYPWGPEAFQKAQAENKPIFLSIGYATCHWCHVMAKESFAHQQIADLLNRYFVAVKVDRQEHPQVDELYMRAAVQMLGYGGWPLSVFCTPEGLPFFAGTYFPPEPRQGLPSFAQVLTTVATLWQQKREEILASRRHFRDLLIGSPSKPGHVNLWELEQKALATMSQEFDPHYGGFGPAPKFPMPARLRFLLSLACAGDASAQEMLTKTLNAMAQGGLRDPLFGGFHRYSTDAAWFVPHYEKMLVDNALLAPIYLEAGVHLGYPRFQAVGHEVLGFLLRLGRFTSASRGGAPGGRSFTLAAGWDADTHGEEGGTFTFTWDELQTALSPEEVELITGLSPFSWQPHQKRPLAIVPVDEQVARSWHKPLPQLRLELHKALKKLVKLARAKGLPAVDELPVVAWNAMAVRALVAGFLSASLTGRSPRSPKAASYLRAALQIAETLWERGWSNSGSMPRTLPKQGQSSPETLEDVAWAAMAFLELFLAGGDLRWFSRAQTLLQRRIPTYRGPTGELYTAPEGQRVLAVAQRSPFDGAHPSPGAVACEALFRTWLLSECQDFHHWAHQALVAEAALLEASPANVCSWLTAARLAQEAEVLVIAGDPAWPSTRALRRTAYLHRQAPAMVVVLDRWPPPPEALELLPILRGKAAGPGHQARAYLCRQFQCWPPSDTPQDLAHLLDQAAQPPYGPMSS